MSFGFTTTTFSYLSVVEVVQLQILNRWMYQRGIARVQTSLKLPITHFYFTAATESRSKSTLYHFDRLAGTCERLVNEDFDFGLCVTVQVRLSLYCFARDASKLTKYTRFFDGCTVRKRRRPALE